MKTFAYFVLAAATLFVAPAAECFAAKPPTISNVAATNLGSSAATITWTTNLAATSQVEYGKTTSYGSSTLIDNTLVTSHYVELRGLTPNTIYHYRVKSQSSPAGTITVSSDFTFKTFPLPPLGYVLQFWDTPSVRLSHF